VLRELIFPPPGKENGLLNEYVQRLPLGTVGPYTMAGLYVREPIIRGPDGTLILNPRFKALLARFKQEQARGAASDNLVDPGIGVGVGCPISFGCRPLAKSPLQNLLEAYYELFVKVDTVLGE